MIPSRGSRRRRGASQLSGAAVSRRGFLQIGTLGVAGLTMADLTLADLLRAEAAAGIRSSRKAVINVHLDGGPPHLDMIDLKPAAPAEIRGEFQPIPTALAGFQICELLPKLASIADKFAFVRSLVGSAGIHDAFQCQSGFPATDLQSLGGRPALGSVVARLQSRPNDTAPPFVDLMQGRGMVRNSARPGFLGPSWAPFRPDISHLFTRELQEGMKSELARRGGVQTSSLSLFSLNPELSIDRLDDRLQLLRDIDRVRHATDASGTMDAIDSFHQQALNIVTSGRFAQAMDLDREDARTLQRYTLNLSAAQRPTSDEPSAVRKFLLARRLVEAGVRCVSLSLSDYDTHSDNFTALRGMLPVLDHGLHALVTDMADRGMLDDVSVVVWGEFGRTPRINKSGGRDHWPAAGMVLLAGGGMRTGQVIGETDRQGGHVVSRPVSYQDVVATLYHNLGIDPATTTMTDPSGRPQPIAGTGQVIAEIV